MSEDFRTLGLEQGATQAEIKKAYFTLVREHSPEKDPEGFQKIRSAYERLRNLSDEERIPVTLSFPKEEAASELFGAYTRSMESRLYAQAASYAEMGTRLYPDCESFWYCLTNAYMLNGKSGNAVKAATELVRLNDSEAAYQLVLGRACHERGFIKKSLVPFSKAYAAGLRDIDFELDYSSDLLDAARYEESSRVLLELLSRSHKWKQDELEQALYAIFLLTNIAEKKGTSPACIKDMLDVSLSFVSRNQRLFKDEESVYSCFNMVSDIHHFTKHEKDVFLHYADQIDAVFKPFEDTFDTLDIKYFKESMQLIIMKEKYGFSESLLDSLGCCMAYTSHPDQVEAELLDGALLSCQLMLLAEGKTKDGICRLGEILEKNCPDFYAPLADFFKRVRFGTDLNYLKSKMLKAYKRRLSQYWDPTFIAYAAAYPNDMR